MNVSDLQSIIERGNGVTSDGGLNVVFGNASSTSINAANTVYFLY